MTEIIRRESKFEKENLMDKEFQVSINNWGHLAFRFFDAEIAEKKKTEDILLVFPKETTRKIISFIRRLPEYW